MKKPFNGDSQVAAGGEIHQIADGQHPALTTNQGVALSDNQTRFGQVQTALRLGRILSLERKLRISITSVFQSVSFTRAEQAYMDSSS